MICGVSLFTCFLTQVCSSQDLEEELTKETILKVIDRQLASSNFNPSAEFMIVMRKILSPSSSETEKNIKFYRSLEEKELRDFLIATKLYFITSQASQRKIKNLDEAQKEALRQERMMDWCRSLSSR